MGMNPAPKKEKSGNLSSIYYGALTITGATLWLAQVWGAPFPAHRVGILLAGAAFFAALTVFSAPINRLHVSLTQVTFLGMGVVFGVPETSWSALMGLVAGSVVRIAVKRQPAPTWRRAAGPFYQLGMLLTPYLFSDAAINWQMLDTSRWIIGFVAAGVYLGVHALLVLLGVWVENRGSLPPPDTLLRSLFEIEILPLPFLLAGWAAAPNLDGAALIVFGGVPLVVSAYLSDRESGRVQLERQMEDLLQRARVMADEKHLLQAREQLTETLVHDLRSPMGAVKASLELLEEALALEDLDPAVGQALGIAGRSTERVLVLVNLLLDTSKLESDQMELKLEEIDLAEMIETLVEVMLPQSVEDDIALTYNLSGDLPAVMADREVVYRVVVNLVDNALKFTPEGGRVEVGAGRGELGEVQILVSDTGPGIPKNFRKEIFSRFVQVPGTLGKRRGAGLGLAFCRAAIKAHGGKIWVEDAPQGTGARFVFTLVAAE